MAINLTDTLNAATIKGKLADAKQIYLEGDNKNLQDAYKDNEDHLSTLDTRSTQIEESLKTIAATGGASNANAVIYDNNVSGLTAINVNGALDELTTRFTEIKNNVGLYNVDKNIPLGSGYYTSTTARSAIPSAVRKLGLIITYKTDSTTSVTEQFIGSAVSGWTTNTNWKNIGSEGGNKILEWNTDVATTRKQVQAKFRKSGIQISYKYKNIGWVNEQYIGIYFQDSEWVKDSNWEQIPNQQQLSVIENNLSKYLQATNSVISSIIAGNFINKDGTLTSISNGVTSEFIPYDESMNLEYSGKYGANAVGIVFYNSLFEVIGYQFEDTSSVSVYNETITPTENTAYLRGCSLDKNNFEIRNINITDTAEELKKDIAQNTSDIQNNTIAISELEKKIPKTEKPFEFSQIKEGAERFEDSAYCCEVFKSNLMPDAIKITHIDYEALNAISNNKIIILDILDGETQAKISKIISIPDATVGNNSIDTNFEISNNQLLFILGNNTYITASNSHENPYNEPKQSWAVGNISNKNVGDVVSINQKYGLIKVLALTGIEYEFINSEDVAEVKHKTNNYLYKEILSVTGDSEAAGHNIGVKNTYGNLIAGRNSMVINNYAQNGRKLVTGTASALVDTYQEISLDSNYILVHIGYNDAFDSAQQEIDDNSQDKTTFKGAFNVLVQGLQSRYPKAKIGFIAPYYFTSPGSYHKARAEWVKERCSYYHVQCLDLTPISGLRYNLAEQSEYFIDQVHLTALGHKRISYIIENFVRGL